MTALRTDIVWDPAEAAAAYKEATGTSWETRPTDAWKITVDGTQRTFRLYSAWTDSDTVRLVLANNWWDARDAFDNQGITRDPYFNDRDAVPYRLDEAGIPLTEVPIWAPEPKDAR